MLGPTIARENLKPTVCIMKRLSSCRVRLSCNLGTWFRLLTKRVLRSEEKNTFQQTRKRLSKKEYIWFEMGFFTFWSKPDFCRILCIGTPPELQLALQADLMQRNPGLEFKHPFGMFAPLIDQIVELYDDSVWRLRDPIRKIERVWFFSPTCPW